MWSPNRYSSANETSESLGTCPSTKLRMETASIRVEVIIIIIGLSLCYFAWSNGGGSRNVVLLPPKSDDSSSIPSDGLDRTTESQIGLKPIPDSSADTLNVEERSASIITMTKPGRVNRKEDNASGKKEPSVVYEENWAKSGSGVVEHQQQCSNARCDVLRNCVADSHGQCFKELKEDLVTPRLSVEDLQQAAIQKRVVPRGGDGDTPLRCSWMVEEPSLPPSKLELERSKWKREPKIQLDNFNHISGSFFHEWYRYGSTIVETRGTGSTENYRFQAEHSPTHYQNYVLKNVCIRPSGQLAGFSPIKREPYQGQYEWPLYPNVKEYSAMVDTWLTKNLEVLDEPPKWFLDRKLIIQPILNLVGKPHSVHWMVKDVQLIHNTIRAFGGDNTASDDPVEPEKKRELSAQEVAGVEPTDDLTTLYLNFDTHLTKLDPLKDEKENKGGGRDSVPPTTFKRTGHHRFQTLVSKSHLFAFANYDLSEAIKIWMTTTGSGKAFVDENDGDIVQNRRKELEAVFTNPICFKEAVVWQGCPPGGCKNSGQGRNDAWVLDRGPKFSETTSLIARRLRSCAGVTKANEHLLRGSSKGSQRGGGGIRLTYATRTGTRGVLNSAVLVGKLLEWTRQHAPEGSSLKVAELVGPATSIPNSILWTSTTDILVGPWGGGISFCFLMPPKSSTTLMLSPVSAGSHKVRELEIDADTGHDMTGMMLSIEGHAIKVNYAHTMRVPSYHMNVPPEPLRQLVETAVCYYKSSTRSSLKASAKCGVDKAFFAAFSASYKEAETDLSGIEFERALIPNIPTTTAKRPSGGNISSLNSRLAWLRINSAKVAYFLQGCRSERGSKRLHVTLLFDIAEERLLSGADDDDNAAVVLESFVDGLVAEVKTYRDYMGPRVVLEVGLVLTQDESTTSSAPPSRLKAGKRKLFSLVVNKLSPICMKVVQTGYLHLKEKCEFLGFIGDSSSRTKKLKLSSNSRIIGSRKVLGGKAGTGGLLQEINLGSALKLEIEID